MSIRAEVLDALLAAGATAEMIVAAVKADLRHEEEKVQEKREKDAERQRKSRLNRGLSRPVTVTPCDSRDECDAPPSLDKEIPPRPPKEINPIPVCDAHTREPTPIASPKAKSTRISTDWTPTKALPEPVAALVALWPPGRVDRELDGFRDYWVSRSKDATRTDWDRAWWNRIRDQHDRIIRENRNGNSGSHAIRNRYGASSESGHGRTIDAAFAFIADGGPH